MKQGTIKTYDAASRSGTLLDDAKSEFAYGPESFLESGVREFRLGQRVKFNIEGEGDNAKIRDLTLVTL